MLRIWVGLRAAHVALAALAWVGGAGDHGAAIVIGSIYVPLGLYAGLGLPVFARPGYFLAELSGLGWALAAATWLVVYGAVASLLAWAIRKRRTSPSRNLCR